MNEEDQIKTFQAMAEVSRKWVTVLDAKAAFLVAINGALLSFVWTGAKLPESPLHWVKALGYLSSAITLISLFLAVTVVFPRIRLDTRPSVQAVTFFAHVAKTYPESEGSRFVDDVLAMTSSDLAREALEQHHAISHVAWIKNTRVTHAASFWACALMSTVIALTVRAAG